MRKKRLLLLAMAAVFPVMIVAQKKPNVLRTTDAAFFKTEEARRIGEQVLAYQRITGGWPKNIDMVAPLSSQGLARVRQDFNRRDDSTTDNNATNMQMCFLARLYQSTGDARYRDAFHRGVAYLLSGQYPNGGWPQFWPEMRDYQIHITFNDNAMVNTMNLLRDVATQAEPFGGKLTDKKLRKQAKSAFDKGVECILKCQIRVDGEPTVWCQQHDRESLAPAPARSYELPSFVSQESAGIVKLLMSIPHPTEAIKQSVRGAMKWFDTYKLTGLRVVRTFQTDSTERNTYLVKDENAEPIWSRFYDLEKCEPFLCDRDGIPRHRLDEIGPERRNGYAWFDDRARELYPLYEAWAAQNDPENALRLDYRSPGANERGLFKVDY